MELTIAKSIQQGCKNTAPNDFLRCLSASVLSNLLIAHGSPSFQPELVSSIRNAKFVAPATARPPACIVKPTNASHVQAAVHCGRRHGVRVSVRSGGHDCEGLSYLSSGADEPAFAVLDLANMRGVRVNRRQSTAWVDSGATIGKLYYGIGKAAPGLGFPAGVGGGMGLMMRKYGLSADNVLDATMVDANGNLLSGKKAMGKDLFWAIRGGGGGSFGIVLSWKIKLVPVPATVTYFDITKTMAQGAVDAVTKWQTVAPALPEDLGLRVVVENKKANFQGLSLSSCSAVVPLVGGRLPELGMTKADCREMSWVEYTAYIYFGDAARAGKNGQQLGNLLNNRSMTLGPFVKNKSDYVKKPIPKSVWEKIFTWPYGGAMDEQLVMEPHGGQVGSVPDAATPFPHRSGVLYNIQYVEFYPGSLKSNPEGWVTGLYKFMEPWVSSNPRGAYANYRDLDMGVIKVGRNGKYFGADNFRRLALTKAKVDPHDFFRHAQSVPPLVSGK
ncbi:hypothetical protein BRADI_5g02948v3 [Brachypodium distachyon]|uniref:FAD-binding PCMH-type domain-containing protein n=1 Tax=Brachypodium distachyon TaxID=15368 RepID=A0A0Q3GLZ2_BRADI|nr:hypothetical protein BRADI_5g02948v3 [Brachypodium distachyon]